MLASHLVTTPLRGISHGTRACGVSDIMAPAAFDILIIINSI